MPTSSAPSSASASAPEQQPLGYHQLLLLGRPSRAWALAGVLLLLVLVLLGQYAALVSVQVPLVLAGWSADDVVERLSGDPVTPAYLALVDAGWAYAVIAVLAVVLLVHKQRPGWVVSVAARMRWGWLLRCLGLAAITLVVTVVVSALVPATGTGQEISGNLNDWTSQTTAFLLVVLLLTPLQAAGEEFVFRGYLTQAFGRMVPTWAPLSKAVAVVVPAVLFALAHGAQDAPVFVDRFAFGLVAGVLVLRTGGLEAGIAMHVLNNLLAYGVALLFSDMTSTLNPTASSWSNLPVTLTQSLVFLGLVELSLRRRPVATTTAGPVLAGQGTRV
ncbi:CPBP family intramembrane glutamic endopeptidase [Nocardioides bruguierae]|uniref:CPBP family intramembrane metalloprotease n=1 Tax=Nocardioides bruguierae TaxID=2945102 RepID=A0A9X2D5T0_9ACTN|nr:type II CAAX endopeptidase family protein [Nocardioides bruguierae]MCM0619696.1 CPBP family intramembrane metalloprotease [Nocardioides bruguierae]